MRCWTATGSKPFGAMAHVPAHYPLLEIVPTASSHPHDHGEGARHTPDTPTPEELL
jgi:hypothetical protein